MSDLQSTDESELNLPDDEPDAELTAEDWKSIKGDMDFHSVHLRNVIEVAEKHGWMGVENSKVLWTFLDDRLTELENECKRRHGVIEAQIKLLAVWRRMAEEDAGRLARYQQALEWIGSRQVGLIGDAYIAFNLVKDRAQAELGTEAPGRAAGREAATRPPTGDRRNVGRETRRKGGSKCHVKH